MILESRIRRYCEILEGEFQSLGSNVSISLPGLEREHPEIGLKSSYLEWVAHKFFEAAREMAAGDRRELAERQISAAAAAMMRRAESVDRDAQKRTFFEAYLSPPLLEAPAIDCPATFEILRTLSFIGTPVEAVVLLYAPKVRAILAERNKPSPGQSEESLRTDAFSDEEIRNRLAAVIATLRSLSLLIELDPHDPDQSSSAAGTDIIWQRYGLHRSLATFLRDRHGAPINDAKLATTFNLSMFMSEPSEATTPEVSFHDELGDLVDGLIGAWRDIPRIQDMSDLGLQGVLPAGANVPPRDCGKKWLELFDAAGGNETEDDRRVTINDLSADGHSLPRARRACGHHPRGLAGRSQAAPCAARHLGGAAILGVGGLLPRPHRGQREPVQTHGDRRRLRHGAAFDQAIAIGTSKGYNHALERVHRALNPTVPNTNWTYIKVSG